LSEIWESAISIKPQDAREAAMFSAMLSSIDQVGENRRMRALVIASAIPMELWLVTFVGGAIIISFTYLFTAEKTILHACMIGMVAVSLALNVFLLVAFTHAFSGVLKIKPDGFKLNVIMFQKLDEQAALKLN